MKRIYPSGAEKRKKRKAVHKESARHAGSLDQWIKPLGDETTDTPEDVPGGQERSDESEHNPPEPDEIPGPSQPPEELSREVCQPETETSKFSEPEDQPNLFLEKNDFGFLKRPVSDELRLEIVKRGPAVFQNTDAQFFEQKGRSFSRTWFKKVTTNGEEVERSWLLYSPHKESCLCFACFYLFCTESTSHFCREEGFSGWKKLNPRIPDHEASPLHRESMRKYLDLALHLKTATTVDADLQKQLSAEKMKWQNIIERVVEVVTFLSKQNLAFRGHRGESISELAKPDDESEENMGKFFSSNQASVKVRQQT
jgi:hypothetical protein